MIIFELSMPKINTWNNKWSCEGETFARYKQNIRVPAEIIDKTFEYDFGDGWVASVSVRKVKNNEAKKIMAKSKGFMGYDWMIDSLIKYHDILPYKQIKEMESENS